ncbi:MAG: hypothetical protein K0S56_4678, partial [Microvirga sp.]|nr:hypothetical protein [Microvirga sp.]
MSIAIAKPESAPRSPTMIVIVRLFQSRSFLIGAALV